MRLRGRFSSAAWPWILGAGFAVALATWSPVPEHELPPDTPWHVLMDVESHAGPPAWSDTLRHLDGRPIRLTGFMFPLEGQSQHRHFLLSAHPAGCAFHAPGGPASLVEVFAAEPVPFTYEPVAVRGTFRLAGRAERDVFYQIGGATVEDVR